MIDICEAYYRWLGIPPKDHPPDHYRLLGIERYESNPDVIRDAADRQMVHVRNYQLGKYSKLSQQMLNELAAARVCLLQPERKLAYDESLRRREGTSTVATARPVLVAQGPDVGYAGQDAAPIAAVAGVEVSHWRKDHSGWGAMLIGFGGASAVALVAVMVWWAIAGANQSQESPIAARTAAGTADTAVPSADELPPPPPPVQPVVQHTSTDLRWSMAAEEVAALGPLRVRVLSAAVERPHVVRRTGRIAFPNEEYLVVTLELENTDATRKVDYVGWGGGIYGNRGTLLVDDSGEPYPVKLFAGGVVEGQQHNISLYAGQPIRDVLVFQRPPDTTKYLRLSLPGEAVDIEGVVRFEIPGDMIAKATAKEEPSTVVATRQAMPAKPPVAPETAALASDEPMPQEPVQEDIASSKPEIVVKQPPPALAEQQKIRRTLEELCDVSAVQTPAKKMQLAASLVKLADKTDDTAERFVLLRQASELAASAGEVSQVLQLVDQMAEKYEIDRLAAQAYLLNGMVDAVGNEEQIQAYLVGSAAVIYDAVDAERFDVADSLSTAVCSVCQCPVGRPFRGEARERRQEFEMLRERWGGVQVARETLRLNPEDEKANTIVGEWHCLVRGEWDQGLPYLAKGTDRDLRTLAGRETQEAPKEVKAQVAMADAWWDFANAAGQNRSSEWNGRAAYWYERAYPELDSPLVKAKVEKRLTEMGKSLPGSPEEDDQEAGGLWYDNPKLSSMGNRQLSDLFNENESADSEEGVQLSSSGGEPCPTCKGKGVVFLKCPNRHCARGTVRDYRYQVMGLNPVSGQKIVQRVPIRVPCPVCGGDYIRKVTCPDCHGTGVKQSESAQ